MAARFPQSAAPIAYRIASAWASKILAVYWPASADSVHRLYPGDNTTVLVTRAASGAGFNVSEGRITGNVRGAGGVYFSDSKSGGFGATEADALTYIASYHGDLFAGVGDPWVFGCATPMDTFNNVMSCKGNNYTLDLVRPNASVGSLASNMGAGDDVPGWMTFGLRHAPADPVARYRTWANGAELAGIRNTGAPPSSVTVGAPATPFRFGGTATAAGNTRMEGECWIVGAALTDSDMAAITANPSILIEPASVQPTLSGSAALAAAVLSGAASVRPVASGAAALASAVLSGSASISGASATASGDMGLSPAVLAGAASSAAGSGGATVVGDAIADPDGVVLRTFTIPKVLFVRLSDMQPVLSLTNQTTDADGMMSRTSAGFVAGIDYLRVLSDATGATTGCKAYRAT